MKLINLDNDHGLDLRVNLELFLASKILEYYFNQKVFTLTGVVKDYDLTYSSSQHSLTKLYNKGLIRKRQLKNNKRIHIIPSDELLELSSYNVFRAGNFKPFKRKVYEVKEQ